MTMTKKELAAISSAAFNEFNKQHGDRFGTSNLLYVYDLSEVGKSLNIIVNAKTQINSNTLADNGFSDGATVKLLFTADRKTKQLYF